MRVLATGIVLLMAATVASAQTVDPILLNATTNSGGDEAPGLGTNFSSSSQVLGTDDEEGAFGNNDGPVEPNTFIFGDGGVADNGNGFLGDGGETVDSLNWNTTGLVLLDGYRANISGDGGGANRATELFSFSVAGEADDLFDNNAGSGAVDRLFSVPQLGSAFGINTTRTVGSGPRINEIDAIVPDPIPANLQLDPILFNAVTNVIGEGDEAPGLSTNFVTTAVIGSDNVEDAFGNNNGAVEPDTLIFADGGVADNGNNTLDAGQETIDSIIWQTTSPVAIGGYEITVGGDTSGPHAFRGTELVSFFVEGNLVDTIDLNGYRTAAGSITIQRPFSAGVLAGNDFQIEFTRSTAGGLRLFEVNALTAIVPEPSSFVLAGLAAMGLVFHIRRRTNGAG